VVGLRIRGATPTYHWQKARLSRETAASERRARTHPCAALLGEHDHIRDSRLLEGDGNRRN